VEGFLSLLNTLYTKKHIKYDIVFYYNLDLENIDEYFVDLYKWIDKDIINKYDPQILSLTCLKNNKLVGLVRLKIYKVISYIKYRNNYN